MAALQVIVECQLKLTIKENKRGEAKVMDSQRPGLNKSKHPDRAIMIRLKLSQTEMNDLIN